MRIMIPCHVFIIVSLLDFLRDVHVSGCDVHCEDKPVFTPSRLVVKHGDPTSAACSVCRSCQSNITGLERAVGDHTTNGTTILWTVENMTEWATSPICYYAKAVDEGQCCTFLSVTVYKPPDSVSIGFTNHSGPMFASHQYTLRCDVLNVAPIGNLIVTFYRGRTPLGPGKSKVNAQKKPASEVFTLSINASKEDDGVQYRCKAELQLGPEGPQPPPVVESRSLRAAVHYKPQHQGPTRHDPITVTAGDPLRLNCETEGNPGPSYTWTLLPASLLPPNSSVLSITSAASKHGGRYACSASNAVGTTTVTFHVVVKPNIIPYIAVAAVVVLILVIIVPVFLYKYICMGQYTPPRPGDVCCFRNQRGNALTANYRSVVQS